MFATSKVFHVNAKSQRAFAAKQGNFSTLRVGQHPSFAKRERAEEH